MFSSMESFNRLVDKFNYESSAMFVLDIDVCDSIDNTTTLGKNMQLSTKEKLFLYPP